MIRLYSEVCSGAIPKEKNQIQVINLLLRNNFRGRHRTVWAETEKSLFGSYIPRTTVSNRSSILYMKSTDSLCEYNNGPYPQIFMFCATKSAWKRASKTQLVSPVWIDTKVSRKLTLCIYPYILWNFYSWERQLAAIGCARFNLPPFLERKLRIFKEKRALDLNPPFQDLRLKSARKSNFIAAQMQLFHFWETNVFYTVGKIQLATFPRTKVTIFFIKANCWFKSSISRPVFTERPKIKFYC